MAAEKSEGDELKVAESQMKDKVLKGLFWKILENGGAQGIQFVIAIILARLLARQNMAWSVSS